MFGVTVTVLFVQLLATCLGSGVVEIRLGSFSNAEGKQRNGECCDSSWWSWFDDDCDPCDHVFDICLGNDTQSSSMDTCAYGRKRSLPITQNQIDFGSGKGGLNNPLLFPFVTWPGVAKLKLDILDSDGSTFDFIDHFDYQYRPTEMKRIIDAPVKKLDLVGSVTKMQIEFRVYCDPYYYGMDCAKYCRSREDDSGHYRCNPVTGDKICSYGWGGKDCLTNMDDCIGNRCEAGSTCIDQIGYYTCKCPPGRAGVYCGGEINECASSPCQNGGTCVDKLNGFTCECLKDWSGRFCEDKIVQCAQDPCINGYCTMKNGATACVCHDGYTGKLCEKKISSCADQPCVNMERCEDLDSGKDYKCVCKDGYTGKNCDIKLSICDSDPCYNNGICKDLGEIYVCVCQPGYYGERCALKTDYCSQNPCQNGGFCLSLPTSYTCICPDFTTGANCEKYTNDCYKNPCQNGGTCINLEEGYRCICPPNTDSPNCEIFLKIDACRSSPCKNGATCTSGDYGDFSCDCPIDYKGRLCDISTDYCRSQPCQNGGVCSNLFDTFDCTCEDGYTGRKCETEINECEEQPCQHGGTCIDLLNGFACSCAGGFTGKVCEESRGVSTETVEDVEESSGETDLPSSGDVEVASGDVEITQGETELPSEKPELPAGGGELTSWDFEMTSGETKVSLVTTELPLGDRETTSGGLDITQQLTFEEPDLPSGDGEMTSGDFDVEIISGDREPPLERPELPSGEGETTPGIVEITSGETELSSHKQQLPSGEGETTSGDVEIISGQTEIPLEKPELSSGDGEITSGDVEELFSGDIDILSVTKGMPSGEAKWSSGDGEIMGITSESALKTSPSPQTFTKSWERRSTGQSSTTEKKLTKEWEKITKAWERQDTSTRYDSTTPSLKTTTEAEVSTQPSNVTDMLMPKFETHKVESMTLKPTVSRQESTTLVGGMTATSSSSTFDNMTDISTPSQGSQLKIETHKVETMTLKPAVPGGETQTLGKISTVSPTTSTASSSLGLSTDTTVQTQYPKGASTSRRFDQTTKSSGTQISLGGLKIQTHKVEIMTLKPMTDLPDKTSTSSMSSADTTKATTLKTSSKPIDLKPTVQSISPTSTTLESAKTGLYDTLSTVSPKETAPTTQPKRYSTLSTLATIIENDRTTDVEYPERPATAGPTERTDLRYTMTTTNKILPRSTGPTKSESEGLTKWPITQRPFVYRGAIVPLDYRSDVVRVYPRGVKPEEYSGKTTRVKLTISKIVPDVLNVSSAMSTEAYITSREILKRTLLQLAMLWNHSVQGVVEVVFTPDEKGKTDYNVKLTLPLEEYYVEQEYK